MGQHYSFEHYGPDNGLHHLAVHGLLQDQKGFLWVTTSNGLYRYDGARFQTFGLNDGLPSPRVHAIHESKQGILWVGTSSGAAMFDGRRFLPVDLGISREVPAKQAISSDAAGNVYIGTTKGLVVGTPAKSGREFIFARPRQDSPPHTAPVQGVHVDPDGIVWFDCGRSLCRMDAKKVTEIGLEDGLPPDHWESFLNDRSGNLWIRSTTKLFVHRRGGAFSPVYEGLPVATNASDLALDRAGNLLVATDAGLARRAGGKWELIGTKQGLRTDTISAVLTDREGSTWIGEWGNGLSRWIGDGEWVSWSKADGLQNPLVWAVRRDKRGTVWAGTDNGLYKLNEPDWSAKVKVWTKKDGLGENKIKAIATGPDDDLWIGTSPGGVTRFNARRGVIARFGTAQGLTEDRVIGLFADPEDRLWVSTATGLYRSTVLTLPNIRFERQQVPGGDTEEMFFRFFLDRDGRLWVGAAKGLVCWDRGAWKRFTSRDGLKRDGVTHIAQDSEGALWVGYREPLGVSRLTFPGGLMKAEHFTQQGTLSSDYILFIGRDARGWLWVGTDSGVDVLRQGKWHHIRRSDGLVWDDCAANGFSADEDGGVWIGTLNGLSHFHPRLHSVPKIPPPIYLTAVDFGGTGMGTAKGLRIPYKDRFFDVGFASPSFVGEKNMSFEYRLVGLEEAWKKTSQREARYPGLSPGEYEFEVIARTQDGLQSPSPARLTFEILSPWWQSWWFRLSCGCALLAVVAGIWSLRVRHIIEERRKLEAAVQERTRKLVSQNQVIAQQKQEIEVLLQKAREASSMKSQFLANTSHEIRTPMNAIIGMTSLALETTSAAEQNDYLRTVKDSAESLMALLNEILDLSKIEANRFELECEPFSLGECLDSAVKALRPIAASKGLDIVCNCCQDAPDVVAGDSFRLRQIIWNLVGNAIKFTSDGSITVSMQHQGIENGWVLRSFSVQDSGIGISPEKLSVIFEPFQQADGSTTRKYGGTGLGLDISSRLVEMMGGRIWVDSEPGKGSTFHFTARFRQSTEALAPCSTLTDDEQTDPGTTHEPLRILLAEDNTVNQRLAVRLLEKDGHTVTVVGNGREALEELESDTFDLVLMDVQMPEMDGMATTAMIRERESGSAIHIPICALTAHAMVGDRQACLSGGMDAYISKPIQPEELRKIIRKFSTRTV